jgi:hypothetical protein
MKTFGRVNGGGGGGGGLLECLERLSAFKEGLCSVDVDGDDDIIAQ